MKLKLTRINEHAYQLTRFGFVNCYLVREQDSFTLVDANLAGLAPDILGAAGQLGTPIRRILLTHAHVDHIGSVDALVEALPGVTVAISERSVPLLQRPPDKALLPGETGHAPNGGLPGLTTAPTHIIAPDELFGSLRCIATPGHLPGHFSYFDERDGTLYAGDALATFPVLCMAGAAPWYFPILNIVIQSAIAARQSAERLCDYPFQRIAPGHGKVLPASPADLRATIAKGPRPTF